MDMEIMYKKISKIVFTSSSYTVFLSSNLCFLGVYSCILLQKFYIWYFLLGIFGWSAWEYMYHRFLMHYTNSGKWYHYIHGHHHVYPNKISIHLPLFQYFLVVFPFYCFLKYVLHFHHNQNISYTIGHLISLCIFENTHKEIHQPYWFPDENTSFRVSHLYHHNRNKNKAFCFTCPLFDILCRTFPDDVLVYNWNAFLPLPLFSYMYGVFPKKNNIPTLDIQETKEK